MLLVIPVRKHNSQVKVLREPLLPPSVAQEGKLPLGTSFPCITALSRDVIFSFSGGFHGAEETMNLSLSEKGP